MEYGKMQDEKKIVAVSETSDVITHLFRAEHALTTAAMYMETSNCLESQWRAGEVRAAADRIKQIIFEIDNY